MNHSHFVLRKDRHFNGLLRSADRGHRQCVVCVRFPLAALIYVTLLVRNSAKSQLFIWRTRRSEREKQINDARNRCRSLRRTAPDSPLVKCSSPPEFATNSRRPLFADRYFNDIFLNRNDPFFFKKPIFCYQRSDFLIKKKDSLLQESNGGFLYAKILIRE